MSQVLLVMMPFGAVCQPSIALGLLVAGLRRRGIASRVVYANLRLAARLGADRYWALTRGGPLVGEWLFARAAFPESTSDSAYLTEAMDGSTFHEGLETWLGPGCQSWLMEAREMAEQFVEELAREIARESPPILGCSSMLQQHTASLALLRAVRQAEPSIVTVLGGANCEGEMGLANLQAFPWLDLVVSGEADEVFPDLCRQLLDETLPTTLPAGVLHRERPCQPPVARALVRDLDSLPYPDYDDYFEELERSGLTRYVTPAIPLETSRGCWWGQKHHCRFCGVNEQGLSYRAKSPRRALEEFLELHRRHGVARLMAVDSIIDPGYFGTLLPELERSPVDFDIWYEVKANLKKAQVEQLARAGARWVQPGIESLHARALEAMDKGTDPILNLRLLKWARQFGIRIIWNVLFGLPEESDAWYGEMADWLPAVRHLEPPLLAMPIKFLRFSPYHSHPEQYGLSLEPTRAYRQIFPVSPDTLRDLAYIFEDRGPGLDLERWPGIARLVEEVKAWKEAWSSPPRLSWQPEGEGWVVRDTRPGGWAEGLRLGKREMQVLKACDAGTSPAALQKQLDFEVEEVVEQLIRSRLLLRLEARLLSLGLEEPVPVPPPPYPGGRLDLEGYIQARELAWGWTTPGLQAEGLPLLRGRSGPLPAAGTVLARAGGQEVTLAQLVQSPQLEERMAGLVARLARGRLVEQEARVRGLQVGQEELDKTRQELRSRWGEPGPWLQDWGLSPEDLEKEAGNLALGRALEGAVLERLAGLEVGWLNA